MRRSTPSWRTTTAVGLDPLVLDAGQELDARALQFLHDHPASGRADAVPDPPRAPHQGDLLRGSSAILCGNVHISSIASGAATGGSSPYRS